MLLWEEFNIIFPIVDAKDIDAIIFSCLSLCVLAYILFFAEDSDIELSHSFEPMCSKMNNVVLICFFTVTVNMVCGYDLNELAVKDENDESIGKDVLSSGIKCMRLTRLKIYLNNENCCMTI